MHQSSMDKMQRFCEQLVVPEYAGKTIRILDIGSQDINGSYRVFFDRDGWSYVGVDMAAGKNVDIVLDNPYAWKEIEAETFDVVISGQALEHIEFPWLTMLEIARVLKPGGLCCLLAPSNGYEHRYPVDCYRFYPDGMVALAKWSRLDVVHASTQWRPEGHVGDESDLWADTILVARKPVYGAIDSLKRRAKLRGLHEGALYLAKSSKKDGALTYPTPPQPLRMAEAVPVVRDQEYAEQYAWPLSRWMTHHQEKIVFEQVRWMGVQTLKNPLDCWIYQEILHELRPDVLVELGSFYGGSTMYFSHIFDLLGAGTVVSVDFDRSRYQAKHPRIVELTGSTADPGIIAEVKKLCAGKKVMIIHDADHTAAAVLRDLRAYADLVSVGSYFIVEDGVVDVFDHRRSVLGWEQPGPLVASRQFVAEDERFEVDQQRERYLITYNPRGFLRRVR